MPIEEAKARIAAKNPLAGRLAKIAAEITYAEDGTPDGVKLMLDEEPMTVLLSDLPPEIVAYAAAKCLKTRLLDAICGTPTVLYNYPAARRQVEAWKAGAWNAPRDARGKLAKQV